MLLILQPYLQGVTSCDTEGTTGHSLQVSEATKYGMLLHCFVWFWIDLLNRIHFQFIRMSLLCLNLKLNVYHKCNISQGVNPPAQKRKDNCWLAFACTGITGWLSSIMGKFRLPCCASRRYNWLWKRNRFSKTLPGPCIIHSYAQKNTSVPLHTHSHALPFRGLRSQGCSHTQLHLHVWAAIDKLKIWRNCT